MPTAVIARAAGDAEILEELPRCALVHVVPADCDQPNATTMRTALPQPDCIICALSPRSADYFVDRFPLRSVRRKSAIAKFTTRKSERLGALPRRGVVLISSGSLAGLGPDDRFGDPPQTQRHQSHRDDPQNQGAAGLTGECRQRAGLICVTAETKRYAQ